MASNIPITTGSGAASVATEQIGAVQYQQIKVIDGTATSTNKWIINSDGSAQVSVIGTLPVQLSNTSVITVLQTSSIIARVTGSVVTIPTLNQSVSGTVGASVVGWVPIQAANTSVISYVQNSVATVIIGGSIAATFTPPANQSVSGTIQTDVRGSVAVAIISGSIAATFTPPANQSVSGTVQTDVRGSVAVAIISGSIAATFTPPANQSVSGVVMAQGLNAPGASVTGNPVYVGGTDVYGSVAGAKLVTVTSIAGGSAMYISGSVVAQVSIMGQLPAGTAVLGSVAALQGTNPWIQTFSNSSILAVPVGSVITYLQAPSIVGTYAEDAAHTTGDKGVFVLAVRNDTLSSITSADLDYSPQIVGPMGEVVTANAPITKWVSGTNSMLGGVPMTCSVQVIAAQGASVFTYVTSAQVANMGSASVLVTFFGATSSMVGYTIAPAGGGSNVYFQNGLKTNANAAFSASVSGAASVYVSAQGFISKT